MARRIQEPKRPGLGVAEDTVASSVMRSLAMPATDGRGEPLQAARPVDAERRRQRIAEIAYYRAERRGFSGGSALEDWLVAERAVDAEDREIGPTL